eukprot:COSAG02_NODE_1587_length_11808_cov_8.640875_6_plen_377_part_00
MAVCASQVNDAYLSILSIGVNVNPGLLAKCGGVLAEGLMEKQGQLNKSFQERYFVLWPREECKLVKRGFRVLYYFNSPTASLANGWVRIDQPCKVEDLTQERASCVVRISPNNENSALDAFLERNQVTSLEVRPLTLRWHSSDPNENLEQKVRWSAAFSGHWAEQVELRSVGEQAAAEARVDEASATLLRLPTAQLHRLKGYEERERVFHAWRGKNVALAILSLGVNVNPGLLAKCGGVLAEGLMEKQGQLNKSFQERYFVLWPREECKLVKRGFRVLYYFNSPTASLANGWVRIDQPCKVEDLTQERASCVVRINPNREAAKHADQSGDTMLDSLLEIPLDVRSLTLRWNSSDPNENLEQKVRWSAAFSGRLAER